MHENAPRSNSILYEGNRCWKVPDQRLRANISHTDYFVSKLLGEHRFQTVGHLEDVCYAGLLECVDVVRCLQIAQVNLVANFIHN